MAKQPVQPKPVKPPAPVPIPSVPMNPGSGGWGPTPGGKGAPPSPSNPGGKSDRDQYENSRSREQNLADAVRQRTEAEEELTKAIRKALEPFGALGRFAGTLVASLSRLNRGDGKGMADRAAEWEKDGKGGGGGGLLGGLTGKMGPALAIAGAAKELLQSVGDTIAGAIDLLKNGIEAAGQSVQKLASNDGLGALTTATDAAADAISNIPIFGGVFASALKLAGGSLNVFKGVLDSLGSRARELATLNPTIAFAAAEADVEKFFADLREANANQDEYAALIREQARADREWQRAITELKKQLLPLATKGAAMLTLLARYLPQVLMELAKTNPFLAAIAGPIGQMLDALAEIEKNTRKEDEDPMTALDDLFRMANEGVNIGQAAPPVFKDNPLPPIIGNKR